MSRKWLVSLIFIGVLCLASGVFIWAMTPTPVAAQCGSNPPPNSSCFTCHVEDNPVNEIGEWHGVHSNSDCCAKCHGGNCATMDEDQAHLGVVTNPLSDIYTNCHSCHPDDYLLRAEVFARDLGVTYASSPTPTPAPSGKIIASPLVILPAPEPSTGSAIPIAFVIAGTFLLVAFIIGMIVLIIHLHS
jgi:hypothetical protein